MSTTVDSKVVEMRFDNKQFENGVSETMSTLDKLKQSLSFKGATKGFEDIDAAARGVNMSGLGNAVEGVRVKFDALQVMATTALMNITNSAVNAGKKIVSALTIDPVKAGFQEYETQINAVQTILANTQSKGTTLDDVNKALDELNAYADKTIYNFTEMTRNIGTFTAAGIDLDTSVTAIQGIANLAAVSGSTSQQASTAMYQLSQALSSGTVKLMDWNSVVNAGMGGQVFQDALKETARLHGVAIDSMIESEGSFRETLKDGWLTAEILTDTLAKFTMAAEEGSEEWNNYKKTLMDKGYTEAQATEILKLGNTATDAATKVKTFTQLFDTLKEAAQSGWTQTWEIIIGDFEEAKELFTGISNFIGGFIDSMSKARNTLLEGALGSSPFGKLAEKINEATGATNGLNKSLEEHEAVVDSVIRGDWGNMWDRWNALNEAGYDCWIVQDKVNERLGSSVRHYANAAEAQQALKQSTSQTVEELLKMSDAQLESLGFTKEEIKSLRELAAEAEKTGKPISELIEEMGKLNGRTLLIKSFENIGHNLVKVFTALGEAYREVFPPMTSDQLYNIIDAFHKLTTNLLMNDATAENLKKTFKGVFAILNIVWTTVKGVVGIFAKLLGVIAPVGGSLLDTILGFTGSIGEFLAGVSEAYRELDIFTKAADKLVGVLGPVIQTLRDFAFTIKDTVVGAFEKLKGLSISDIISQIKTSFKSLKETLSSMTFEDFKEIGKHMIDGLIQGISGKITDIRKTITEFCTKVITFVKDIFGIHSPSVVFEQIGGFIVEGFKAGLSGIVTMAEVIFDAVEQIVLDFIDTVKNIAKGAYSGSIIDGILDTLGKVDWVKVFTTLFSIVGAMVTGLINAIQQIINDGTLGNIIGLIQDALVGLLTFNVAGLVKSITGITDGVGDIMSPFADFGENLGKFFKSFSESINGFIDSISATNRAAALKMIAKSILMLAVSVIAFTLIDPDKIETGLLALGAAIAELAIFLKVSNVSKLAPKLGSSLLGLSVALLVLAGVIAIMGNMDADTIASGLLAVAGALAVIAMGLKMLPNRKNLAKQAFAIVLLSQALLTIAAVIGILGSMDVGTLAKGVIAMGTSLMAIAIALKKMPNRKNLSEISTSLIKVGFALLILSGALKIMGSMSVGELIVSLVALAGSLAAILVVMNKLKAKDLADKSAALVTIAGALLVLSVALKVMSSMSVGELITGLVAMVGSLSAMLVVLNKLKAKDIQSKASSVVVMASALLIMAVALKMMGSMSVTELLVGLVAMAGSLYAIQIALNKLKAKDVVSKAAAFVVVASSLLVLAMALKMMATMSWEGIAKGLAIMTVALAEFVIALNLMKGTVAGATAILIAAAALAILTPTLITLGLSAPLAALGLLVIAGAFGVLGIAGLLLGPLAPVITALSVAVGILGAACFLAGVGVLAFATGVSMLAVVGQAGGDVLVHTVEGLIGLIPLFLAKVAEGMANWAEVIGRGAPILAIAVVQLVTNVIGGLLECINTLIPQVFVTLGVIMDELILFLWEYGPKLIDLGFGLLMALLQGIRDNMYEITVTCVDIITEFVDGIAARLGAIIDSAMNLILKFIDGLAAAVEKYAEPLTDAVFRLIKAIIKAIGDVLWRITEKAKEIGGKILEGIKSKFTEVKNAAKDMMNGFIEGVKEKFREIKDAAINVITGAVDGIKDFLGIKSPSRLFMEIGRYTDEGLAIGLTKFAGTVADSALGVGESAVDAMSESLSNISDIPVDDIDAQPTITPVLDLSSVESDARRLNAMLSRTHAMSISSSMDQEKIDESQNGASTSNRGNTYQFTQNNYSPKALSRTEIYRQTKNQFSKFERVTEK